MTNVFLQSERNALLLVAARTDDIDATEKLISLTDAATHEMAMAEAARMGNTRFLECMISRLGFDANYNRALQGAAENLYIDCVVLLLPYSDPKDNHSRALRWAVYYENDELFDLLYPLSDSDEAGAHISPYRTNASLFLQSKIAQYQRDEIYAGIDVSDKSEKPKPGKKM